MVELRLPIPPAQLAEGHPALGAAVDASVTPDSLVAVRRHESPRLSRRGVLGLATLVTGVSLAGGTAAELDNSALSMDIAEPDIEHIPSVEPPELAGIFNHRNEHYRPDFASVVQDGIQTYMDRNNGRKPFYEKPRYYMSIWDLWKSFSDRHYSSRGQPHIDVVGKPYEKLVNFSENNFGDGMYPIDPGSSSKRIADQRLAAAHREDPRPNPDRDEAIIRRAYGERYTGARAHIDHVRRGGQVSTSELFAYFLGVNRGDITTSLIDTTLFLKLTARNDAAGLQDVTNFAPDFKPVYANAKLISDMFYDEFSAELPLSELVAKIDERSELNDYQGSQPYKDYDPVNRAGTPYHVWNLFMLNACGHPTVSQKFVLGYYGMTSGLRTRLQGRVKVRADFRAAHQAKRVRAIFDEYAR